jgi:hypothetical protein
MRKSDLDCADRIAEADHPEAADLPPRPSLTFSFAMKDKIKGKEKDSTFENLASAAAVLPLFVTHRYHTPYGCR